jgi:hypothetical protein
MRPIRSLRHLAAALLLAGALCAPRPAQAAYSQLWINPGIKLAWTFGEGFTYGFELSAVFLPPDNGVTGGGLGALIDQWSKTYGLVFNIDRTTSRVTKLRLGVEWVGPGIGIEAGPSLVLDQDGPHFGIGVTPWAGFYTMPYYTYTNVFGRKNLHEMGMYLKLFRCLPGQVDCGDGSSDPSLD